MLDNREIKFRAWHGGHEYAEPEMLYDEKPGDCLVYRNQKQNIVAVMQYTGLKDKNGKEIYESDRYKLGHDIGTVIYERGAYWINWDTPFKWGIERILWKINNEGEVIGNIYEHPHLLKEANNNAQTE